MGSDITKLNTGNVNKSTPISIRPPAKTETATIPPRHVKHPSIAAILLSRIWKIRESEKGYYTSLMEFLSKVNEACADDFPPENKDKDDSFTLEGYKAIVDNLFASIMKNIETYYFCITTGKYDTTSQLEQKLKCLLDFAQKVAPSLRKKDYPNKIEKVAEVITKLVELDNWVLLEKSLSLLNRIIDYNEQSDKILENQPDHDLFLGKSEKNKKFLEWLRCIGNGYNINSEKKMTFVEILRESQLVGVKELLFQYIFAEKQESGDGVDKKVMKTIRVNAETIGDDKGKPSFVIVKNLAARCQLGETMIPALTCKFRLFVAVKSEEEKLMSVLCSLYAIRAFLAFKKNEETKQFIAEMEPKVRLVPELIQLVKGASIIRPELYKTAIDIISLLILGSKSANWEAGFIEDILPQLGLKVPHNGFLLLLLRDMTSLEIARASNRQEILPKAIIANEDMLISCLRLLKVLYFCTDDGEDRSQQGLPELIRFWRAVASLLMNIIRVREDAKKYIFSLRASYLSVGLIKLIIIRYKTILDQALVTCAIKRLEFELDKLERDDDYMGYENKNQLIGMSRIGEIPELVNVKHRQKLCKMLMNCISNFLRQSPRRDPQGLESIPDIGSDLNRNLHSALRHNERDIMELLHSQRRSGSRRNIADALAVGEEEIKDEQADEHTEERVITSRQVLNSKLIEMFTKFFFTLNTNSKIYYNFTPISYSSMMLIGNLVTDAPASIPTLITQGLIQAILSCLNKKIILADDYFYSVLSLLSALSLHDDAVKQISNYRIITILLSTFLQEEYLQCKQGKYEDCGQLISKICSHSTGFNTEIVNAIHYVVKEVLKKLEKQLKQLAESRKNEKMLEFEKGISKIMEIEGENVKNIAKYNMLILNGISGFLLGIYSNPDSRDQTKLIEALGKNDTGYTAALLNLSKLGKIFSIYTSGYDNISDSFFKILKHHTHQADLYGDYYGSSIGRNELKDIQKELSSGIAMLKELFTESIMKEGIVNYVKKTPTLSSVNLQNFPLFDQVLLMLIHAQWISDVIKHFAKFLQADYGDHLKFITKIYKFILSELMSAIIDNHSIELYERLMLNFINDSKRHSKNENYDSILDKDFSRINFQNFLCSVLPNSLFYNEMFETYFSIIKLFAEINKSTLRNRRYYSHSGDDNTKSAKIAKYSGQCAVELAKEALEVPFKEGGSSELIKMEQSIFHKMILLEDVKCILNGIGIINPLQLYEFYKSDGFDYLHSLYKFDVNYLLADPSKKFKSLPILWEQFQYLTTQIFQIYSIAALPANLRLFSSHSPVAESLLLYQKELTDTGYKTSEDLAASILVNTIDSIFFHVKYGQYKSSLKFLAENAQPAFDLFLNILRKYAKKDVASGIFGSGGSSRYRGGINTYQYTGEVPGYMISEMENMGFETGEAEEAIRRSNLNIAKAMEDLLAQRTTAATSTPAPQMVMASPPIMAKRKIEAKNLSKEIQIWIDHIFISLYEALYIASQYRCKYFIHSLIECQENLRNYKTRHGFIFLLNELQTLLFSIELNYQFSPISNEEFPQIELCDPQFSEKQLKKRQMIMSISGIKEEEYIILFKMKCLINLILTFLRLAKRNDLLKLMYENKFSLCLIEVLKKMTQTEYSISARKSVTKILIMLGMIINESNARAALLPPEKLLSGNGLTEIEMSSLLTFVSRWIDMDNELVAKGSLATTTEPVPMSDIKLKHEDEVLNKELNKGIKESKKLTLISQETITAILVLLIQLSTNPKNTPLIIKSGIIQKFLQIRQVTGSRTSLPIPLLIKLIHNIIESDHIIHEFNFEKIIISLFLGKTHYYSSKKKREKTGTALIEELQKETEEDLDKFTQLMGFLIKRNSNLFYKACDYNCELVSINTMDNSKKPPAKTVKVVIRLKSEVLARIISEEEIIYKQASMMDNKKRINWAVEKCCSIINSSSPQANLIISLLLDRIIELNELTRSPPASMISSECSPLLKIEGIIEILTEIFRNYPEMIALLLTYNNGKDKAFLSTIATNAKVNGNNLISYLLKSVFPQQHILLANGTTVKADKIYFNDIFNKKALQFIKVLTSGNPYLLLYHHNILAIDEIKRRVSIEILNHLQNIIKKIVQEREVTKPVTTPSINCFSAIYSHLEILGSILNYTENSILTPKFNQYQFFQEILISNSAFGIVENLSSILKQIDLHSEQSQSIIIPIINIFERILRFRSAPKKKQEEKGNTTSPITMVPAEKDKKKETETTSVEIANESYIDEKTEK